jgi:hypothetical protein
MKELITGPHMPGNIFMALALLITAVNFLQSFARPLYCWIKKERCSFDMGLPVIGTILLLIACFLLPKTLLLGCLAAVVLLFDTGGVPWYSAMLIAFWYHNRKKQN